MIPDPTSELIDRRLVAEFLRGRSEAAFVRLYDRHATTLYRVGRRLTDGSPLDPEDAVQEAWLRAVRGLPAFAWRSSLLSWLVGVLVNVVRESRRAQAGAETAAAALAPLNATTETRDAATAISLDDAVRALPDGYRTVLILHDVAGFTHREIAQSLDIDEGTAKSQLARARSRLRDHWRGADREQPK